MKSSIYLDRRVFVMVGIAHCIDNMKTYCHQLTLSVAVATICVHGYTVAATITKTCLYNSDPFKSHFYIVKLGFTEVYIIFLIFARKHKLWILVRTASPRRFLRVPTIYVLSRNMKKYHFFYMKIFSFFFMRIFKYIWIGVLS